MLYTLNCSIYNTLMPLEHTCLGAIQSLFCQVESIEHTSSWLFHDELRSACGSRVSWPFFSFFPISYQRKLRNDHWLTLDRISFIQLGKNFACWVPYDLAEKLFLRSSCVKEPVRLTLFSRRCTPHICTHSKQSINLDILHRPIKLSNNPLLCFEPLLSLCMPNLDLVAPQISNMQ